MTSRLRERFRPYVLVGTIPFKAQRGHRYATLLLPDGRMGIYEHRWRLRKGSHTASIS